VSRSIRLDVEALDEIIDGARHYEERERGRGERFSDAVFARIERLHGFPNAGSPVWGTNGVLLARQVRLHKYPYVIVYAVSDDEIRVVAIAHEKQMPLYWASRLDR
jgi:plasmid stabilization system protein ParE